MGDRDDLLQPRRLETLERIMSLYGKHLREGDKIRIGVEGDPCSRFRSANDAPGATVTQILERREDGFMRFLATMEGSGENHEFTNRSFDPDTVWELHPDAVDAFSKRVHNYRGEGASYRSSDDTSSISAIEEKVEGLYEKLAAITKDMSERLAALEESDHQSYRGEVMDLGDMKESEKTFRETMASTIRALAGDTLRVARGEPVEFAHQYVDRYDLALEDRASSVYRGSSEKKKYRNQEEKWNFDSYRQGKEAAPKECSELTDD